MRLSKLFFILFSTLILLFTAPYANAASYGFDNFGSRSKALNPIINEARAINNLQHVAGLNYEHKSEYTDCYFWNGTDAIIFNLAGAVTPGCEVSDINDSDQVVGFMSNYYRNGVGRAFLFENGVARDFLGLPAGYPSVPRAINNQGQIVGEFGIPTDPSNPYTGFEPHGFVWENGEFTQLPCQAIAVGNNNLGDVIAYDYSNCDPSIPWHRGMIWSEGDITYLDFIPRLINDNLQIIGTTPFGGPGFIWEDGVITQYFDINFTPYSINNEGVVVGVYQDGNDNKLLTTWENGEYNFISNKSENILYHPANMNDLGDIAASRIINKIATSVLITNN